ncbi:hypothetical protein GCM10010423_65430 [Streptomyces levis]|uniref:Uncharacterized protein n=1 Tax=Streptomyces levis TaxID=285566 RepID=A0ABN3P143_9ACTN
MVIRFWVAERFGNFYVVDSMTWRVADGTQAYRGKKEAVTIAREYRDEYGAYCKSPF